MWTLGSTTKRLEKGVDSWVRGRGGVLVQQRPQKNESFPNLFSESPSCPLPQVSTFWTGGSAVWMIPARSSPPSSTASASRAGGSASSSGTVQNASPTFWTGNT